VPWRFGTQRLPRFVEIRGGVEGEHSAVGHTNMIVWDDAGEQRARRKARAVDDNVLSRLAQLVEFLDVLANFAARIVNDVHFCERRSRDEGRRERSYHGSLPSNLVLAWHDFITRFLLRGCQSGSIRAPPSSTPAANPLGKQKIRWRRQPGRRRHRPPGVDQLNG
jgi:hypothetical protein